VVVYAGTASYDNTFWKFMEGLRKKWQVNFNTWYFARVLCDDISSSSEEGGSSLLKRRIERSWMMPWVMPLMMPHCNFQNQSSKMKNIL
jgi:hypothetical protein